MFEPGDTCHMHTLTRANLPRAHQHHPTLPVHTQLVHSYTPQMSHSATMQAHLTQQRYKLVRQYSNDCLGTRDGHVIMTRDTASTQSSPTHSVLQPAYSSPHVYNSQGNIYAEVETDYELDSGFTEESVSDGAGDKRDESSSVYTNYSGWPGHLGATSQSGSHRFAVGTNGHYHHQDRALPIPGHLSQVNVSKLGVDTGKSKIFSISRNVNTNSRQQQQQQQPLIASDIKFVNTARGTRGREKHNQIHV